MVSKKGPSLLRLRLLLFVWSEFRDSHTLDSCRSVLSSNHSLIFGICFLVVSGVYDTVFACQRGEIFVLRVDVSRRSELIVQLFGCHAEHPLIDGDMHVRISYHDGNLLGDAVMETIVQMQLDPPKILSFTDDEVKAMQPMRPPVAPTPTPDPPAARNYDHPIEGIEIPVATPVPLQQALRNPSVVDPPTISTLSAGSAGWGFPSQEDRTAQRREPSHVVTGKDQAQRLVMGTTNSSVVSSEHVILVRAEPVPSADDRMMMDTGHRDSSSGGTRLK
jgi:hypothetical protein